MDEFESINSRMPDLGSVLAARIAAKQNSSVTNNNISPGKVDPYQLMLKKKQSETEPIDSSTIQKWPEEAVKKLEDYCNRMGIIGFSAGKMHPLAALAMLKKQLGDDYTDVPLEERIPAGYEKRGTTSTYNSNYPYTESTTKKQILHG